MNEEKDKVEKKAEEISKTFEDALAKMESNIVEKLKTENDSKLDEINKKFEDLSKKDVMKVFVSADVQKGINELEGDEVVDAFAHALFTADEKAIEEIATHAYNQLSPSQKALSEGVNADGGYLVPQDFYNRLVVEKDKEISFRSYVTVVPMKTNVLTIPKHETGPEVYWTAEGETKTTTTMDFSQPTITAYKAAAILYMTDELMEDAAFSLTDLVVRRFAVKMSEFEEYHIMQGSGTGQPTGIFTAGTIATRACTGNLDFDDIIDLIYDLPAKYRRNARFIVHNNNVRELRKLKDNEGRYLWQDPVAVGQPSTIQGYPVYETYDCGEDEIAFGDWKECYWLGERHGLRVKITNDTETTFTKDMTAIRVVRRWGGTVIQPNAARILNTIP